MTLDKLLHISDLRVMGCVVPQWGAGTCGGRAVGEQAHGRTCRAWALRNESSLFSHLSAAAQRSLPEGGGGGGCGVELRSQRAWGESGSFHTNPAYDLGRLTYPSGPQYPHLENEGLEFMVSEVPLSPGPPAGEVSSAHPSCDLASGETVAPFSDKAAGL